MSQYPFKSAQEFADFLISSGLLEHDAWYDPDDWDDCETKCLVTEAWEEVNEIDHED